eukprot:11381285-Alexandrium_andersonii.AAC.1
MDLLSFSCGRWLREARRLHRQQRRHLIVGQRLTFYQQAYNSAASSLQQFRAVCGSFEQFAA